MKTPTLTWDDRVAAWLFGKTETAYVHIMPMIFNHRVVLTPLDDLTGYLVGYCYRDMESAVAACQEWEQHHWTGEPHGYLKRVG